MSRSIKKGPYVDERLLARVRARKQGDRSQIKTWSRDATIVPEMVGVQFGVYNGKAHTAVTVIENMIGHKLGEFAPTRKFLRHGGKMQREQEIKAKEAEKKVLEASKATAPEKK